MKKRDFGLVKSYKIISLFNYLSKIIEKLVAGSLSQYYKTYSKLHIR